ncbi:uncharacterized protein [Bos taurus]|uniref:uncharacterized protein n=1 Tax=Bos taurus TaxID=9913 RepID=UPI00005BE159|nr:uncharacterized protein LOC132342240 [Bos taurus]
MHPHTEGPLHACSRPNTHKPQRANSEGSQPPSPCPPPRQPCQGRWPQTHGREARDHPVQRNPGGRECPRHQARGGGLTYPLGESPPPVPRLPSNAGRVPANSPRDLTSMAELRAPTPSNHRTRSCPASPAHTALVEPAVVAPRDPGVGMGCSLLAITAQCPPDTATLPPATRALAGRLPGSPALLPSVLRSTQAAARLQGGRRPRAALLRNRSTALREDGAAAPPMPSPAHISARQAQRPRLLPTEGPEDTAHLPPLTATHGMGPPPSTDRYPQAHLPPLTTTPGPARPTATPPAPPGPREHSPARWSWQAACGLSLHHAQTCVGHSLTQL